MRDAVSNLELHEQMRQALAKLGVDIDMLAELEPDAALGNGGLGRLAACFMEAMASVDIPAYGYGIRYEHGLFRQEISDGWQVELPETWLAHGNPWEFERREASYEIGFGGVVEPAGSDKQGRPILKWKPAERVIATAFDTPIVGWRAKRVNTLRLWSAKPIDPILLDKFNAGDHLGALAEMQQGRAVDAGPLSGGLDSGRAGTAAATGVFLHVGCHPGHPASPPSAIRPISTILPTRWRSISTIRIRLSRCWS